MGEGRIRRIDAAILPFRVLSSEPSKLLLGLGIGNVSESFIDKFSGEYEDIKAMNATQIELAIMVWGIGILGLLIFCCFLLSIQRRKKAVSKRYASWHYCNRLDRCCSYICIVYAIQKHHDF